jgi:ferredoxin like protein
MDPAAKIAVNAVKDDQECHILIDQAKCAMCRERYCLYVCPGGLYEFNQETGELRVEHTGCLECGSCRVACPYGALDWRFPRGGFGVQYRYG